MEIVNILILGIVQGVSEFLPISSSGHVAIFENLLNYKITLPTELVLNIGTLVALIIFSRSDIIQTFKEVVNRKNLTEDNSINIFGVKFSKKAFLIVISSLPVIFFALVFKDTLEREVSSLIFIAVMMIGVGIYMIVAEKIGNRSKSIEKLNVRDALIIGLAQVLSLLRGTSRSGITIASGIFLNYKREDAVRISFLIGLPALLGSCLVGVLDILKYGSNISLITLSLGFLSSLIAGLISIKILINFVKSHSLIVFSIYRIIVGVLILGYILLVK